MAGAETVTVLMTDVVGSTRLWRENPALMNAAMVAHNAIVAEVVAAYGGELPIEQGEGDSRLAVFAAPSVALAAAVTLAQRLEVEPWPTTVPLKVRMAVHTGEVQRRGAAVYGDALNRCARVRALGHGGQLLVSESAAALLRDALPDGVRLLDLGEHLMKDVPQPERVYQVSHSDLAAEFPPLRSLAASTRNLPVQLSSFIGRERELLDVTKLLEAHRLVTVTGFGGMGKTRLAVAAAQQTPAAAVFFVDLAPVTDPDAVPAAIATALGVQAGLDPVQALAPALGGRTTLVVLDNCEQIIAAGPHIVALLAVAPELRILVTSREPFHVRGEQVYPLPPLGLPKPGTPITAEQLEGYEAVRLFLDRARALRPDLAVTDEDAPVLAAICARLDGLPLALELAAARTTVLSLAALLSRLDTSLGVLTGGGGDRPARHQTMRAAIEWSVEMLAPDTARLLDRMSVFANPADLAGVEAVCGAPALDLLTELSTLVERSLVHRDDGPAGEATYRLLVPIREYAAERLAAAGEDEDVRDRHADHFAALAASLAPHVDHAGATQAEAVARASIDDLRVADLHLTTRRDARPQVELALDLFVLTYSWASSENLPRLERVATRWPHPDGLGAMLASGIAFLKVWDGSNLEPTVADEAVARAQQVGDPHILAFALQARAWSCPRLADFEREVAEVIRFAESATGTHAVRWGGADARVVATDVRVALSARLRFHDPVRSIAIAGEIVTLARAIGHKRAEAAGHHLMGDTWLVIGDWARAKAAFEESVGAGAGFGEEEVAMGGRRGLGVLALHQGDLDTALRILHAAHDSALRCGDQRELSASAPAYGEALHLGGQHAAAHAVWHHALETARATRRPQLAGAVLWRQARAARLAGDLERAAALAVEAWPLLFDLDRIVTPDVLGGLVELAAQADAAGDVVRRDRLLGVLAAQRGPLMPSPCTLLDLAALPTATARTDVNLDDMLSDDETAS